MKPINQTMKRRLKTTDEPSNRPAISEREAKRRVFEIIDKSPMVRIEGAYIGLFGLKCAILLTQCVDLFERSSTTDGWFSRSLVEWENETGLTVHQIEYARGKLVDAGVIRYEACGLQDHYQVDVGSLIALLKSKLSTRT